MYGTPDDLRSAAWQMMSRGVADRKHPARHPTLGTVSRFGPELRSVVLRGWTDGVAEVHTDAASAKVAELRTNPAAALHVWIPKSRLQIRLSAQAEMAQGSDAAWHRIPEAARANYGGTPPPGTSLQDPREHVAEPVQSRFVILTLKVRSADILYLGDAAHQRIAFAGTPGNWTSHWIAP